MLSVTNPLLDSFHCWIRFTAQIRSIAGFVSLHRFVPLLDSFNCCAGFVPPHRFVPLLDSFHRIERNNQSN